MNITPSWQGLKVVGKSPLFSRAYIWLIFVPLGAKFLERFPRTLTYVYHGNPITFQLGLPFSWKVFFFASLFFTAATILFSWKCPPLIRDYDTLDDFKSQGRSAPQVTWFLAKTRRQSKNKGKEWSDQLAAFRTAYQANPKDAELAKEAFGDAFHSARDGMDDLNPGLRRICAFLFLIGFLLIGIIGYQNVMFVVNATFPRS